MAESLVRDAPDLVSLPDIVLQLSEALARDNHTSAEIVSLIGRDPALTARLLRIVNSPYYGSSGRIETLSRAVTLTGLDVLYTLVLTASVLHRFRGTPPSLAETGDFWLHSIHCAEIARLLAKEAAVLHGERLFVAGLLHRIGDLILYARFPEQSQQVLNAAGGDERLIPELERKAIGCSYAEVGAELTKAWGLPPALQEAIRWQWMPEAAGPYQVGAALLHLAVQFKAVSLHGIALGEVLAGIPAQVMEASGLTESRILCALCELPELVARAAGVFLSDRQSIR